MNDNHGRTAAGSPAPLPADARDGADAIPLGSCQWKLAGLWLIAGFILFGLMLGQVAGGRYGSQHERAFGWLLPNLLPSLSMIAGAIVFNVRTPQSGMHVTRFAFNATLWFSVFYLAVLLLVLLLVPVAEQGVRIAPVDWLEVPRSLVSGLSTLVSAALGAFFVSSKPQPEGA